MSQASSLVTAIGYRLDITPSTTTTPKLAEILVSIDESCKWIAGLCMELESELGRTLGAIQTIKKTITGITAANPPVVSSATHGLSDGDEILIRDVLGMTEVNDTWYKVDDKAADTLELQDYTDTDIDGSGYTAYSSSGHIYKAKYQPSFYATLLALSQRGYIQKQYERAEIKLTTEDEAKCYSPTLIAEPEKYYLDGSNNIVFVPTPNDAFIIRIPYYPIPSITAAEDTMPFMGIFDLVVIEAVTIRYQNREEYDVGIELNWLKFLLERARAIIWARKRAGIEVEGI
jgi:hypothetical protein